MLACLSECALGRCLKRVGEDDGIPRIGVFICHCGKNIAGVVDVEALREYASKLEDVVCAETYVSLCTDAGATLIKSKIEECGLDRVVVAACTPKTHEEVFRRVLQEAGLSPNMLEFVNIREHDSFVHMMDAAGAFEKAKDLIRGGVAKARYLDEVPRILIPVKPSVLVIGGGISGIQAALEVAKNGFKVYLVEKSPTIGGRMAMLDRTFPTNDCAI